MRSNVVEKLKIAKNFSLNAKGERMSVPAVKVYINGTRCRYIYSIERVDDGLKFIWGKDKPKIPQWSRIHLEWGTGEIDLDCESVIECDDGYIFKVVGWTN